MPAIQHPLPIKLAKDDLTLLVDIPQSGAELVLPSLLTQFNPNEVFPLHSDTEATQLAQYTPKQLLGYRFAYGEFQCGPYDAVIYHALTPNPLRLLMLRQPVQRVVAVYQALVQEGKLPADTTLEQFVTDDANFAQVWNVQTRWLVGAVEGNLGTTRAEITLSDKALLFVAKQNLEQINALGLAENLPDSITLWNYVFGFKLSSNGNGTAPTLDVSPEALAAIEARNQLDLSLYEFAQEHFKMTQRKMREEILARSQLNWRDKLLETLYPVFIVVIKTLRAIRRKLFPPNTKRDILQWKPARKVVNALLSMNRGRRH